MGERGFWGFWIDMSDPFVLGVLNSGLFRVLLVKWQLGERKGDAVNQDGVNGDAVNGGAVSGVFVNDSAVNEFTA